MKYLAPALYGLGALLAAAVVLAGIALAGVRVTSHQNQLPVGQLDPASAPETPPVRPGTLRVAVVLGASGTVATDAMGPYDVFARSPRFSVYTVAATRDPVDVDGAPRVLPAHTFDEVDHDPILTPDVVVIPAMGDPEGDSEEAVRTWLRAQAARGAQILGVCTGARVLAATGLLDEKTATSHWSQLAGLRRNHPETNWVQGRRYVRDGSVTTTAGVTSGIVGALAVMQQLVGPHEARTVGGEVGYPGWSLAGPTAIPVQSFAFADRPVALNTVLPWFRPTVGVALVDGVSEIDAAAAFEVYNVSSAARVVPVSRTGYTRTRHGMVLLGVPQRQAPDIDQLVQPGAVSAADLDPQTAAWARGRHVALDALTGPSDRAGFDEALEYLAAHTTPATAKSAAKMIDYPTAQLDLEDDRTPHRTTGLATAAVGGSLAAAVIPFRMRRRHRRA